MKKESFIYSTLTIGGSKEQVNEVKKIRHLALFLAHV